MAYIAATVPAKIVRVSNTTLFKVAEIHMGDALRWPEIATLNGLIDPWVGAQVDLKIPPVHSTAPVTGILSP